MEELESTTSILQFMQRAMHMDNTTKDAFDHTSSMCDNQDQIETTLQDTITEAFGEVSQNKICEVNDDTRSLGSEAFAEVSQNKMCEVTDNTMSLGFEAFAEVSQNKICEVNGDTMSLGSTELRAVDDEECNHEEKENKFVSVNKMMRGEKKKASFGTNGSRKRIKAFAEISNHIQADHQQEFEVPKSRSSRPIKLPLKYKDSVFEMNNHSKPIAVKNAITTTKGDHLHKVDAATRDMTEEDMIKIAMEAMGVHDIDEMFGNLFSAIKQAKTTEKVLFKDCFLKSNPSYLLQCYAAWVVLQKASSPACSKE